MEFANVIVPAASVLVGLLSLAGVLIVNKTRKPVETVDLWTRVDRLQTANDALRTEFDTYRTNKDDEFKKYREDQDVKTEARDKERRILRHVVMVVTDGFDAAWQYINILRAGMSDAGITVPEPSIYVKAATDAARDVRANNPDLEEL